MISKWKIILTALAVISLPACEKLTKKNDETIIPDVQTIDTVHAQNSKTDILTLKINIQQDGLLLEVSDLPDGSKLECDLNNIPINPCHDGALLAIPSPGDYVVTAVATKDGKKVAVGKSNSFIIVPQANGSSAQGEEDPLDLVLDTPGFSKNMAWPMNKDLKISWKFFKTPECTATLKCNYPGQQSKFWVDCDKGGTSFTITEDLMASGLQELSVQAQCDSRRGPELKIKWYGVPEGYKPLMIQKVSDAKGRHILNLVKSDDCSAEDLKFTCAKTTGADFSTCENGNVLDNPNPGFKIKAECNGKSGEPVTF